MWQRAWTSPPGAYTLAAQCRVAELAGKMKTEVWNSLLGSTAPPLFSRLALLTSRFSGPAAWSLLIMNKMKNFKRRFSLSVPRTETIEESLTEFTEQFTQLHNQRNEGEGLGLLASASPPKPVLALLDHAFTAGLGGEWREDTDPPPLPRRPAARSSWQRPTARLQHLLPHRQRRGARAAVPWRAVPAAEPAPLLHGGEGSGSVPWMWQHASPTVCPEGWWPGSQTSWVQVPAQPLISSVTLRKVCQPQYTRVSLC